MTSPSQNEIVFLGVAERASLTLEPNTNIPKWNVLGLKHVLLTNFFPVNLAGIHFGFALRIGDANAPIKLQIASPSGAELGTITLATNPTLVMPGPTNHPDGQLFMQPEFGWTTMFFQLPDGSPTIGSAGKILINVLRDDEPPEAIGECLFVLVDPPPLSLERKAAIQSDPHAAKALRMELGCRYCSDKVRAYSALDRSTKTEQEGYLWYEDLPVAATCQCGKTTHDLSTLRRNMFAPLGQPISQTPKVGYVSSYEKGALLTLCDDFQKLLDTKPAEEILQKFIEKNPVLLHQFPSQRLFFKPPILTFFNADFALVTPQKELILLEIETGETRLLKKDGGEAAPLRHAFDQVQSWLHVIDEHRLAVLDSLKVARDAVGAIRGVVIAGRDRGYDAEHLRRLKAADRGRVLFLTFDDLASGLNALEGELKQL